MIDTNHAINYFKDVVEQLRSQEARLEGEFESIKRKKDVIILERSELTASKGAFYSKTAEMTAKVEKADKLHALALKIKQQTDEEREELKISIMELNNREKEVQNLEAKKKQLEDKESLIETRESDIEERELLVEKDKMANRAKQEDNDLRAKSIKKKQERLQKMIDAQKL